MFLMCTFLSDFLYVFIHMDEVKSNYGIDTKTTYRHINAHTYPQNDESQDFAQSAIQTGVHMCNDVIFFFFFSIPVFAIIRTRRMM